MQRQRTKPEEEPISPKSTTKTNRSKHVHVALCALAYAASGALQPTLVDWLRSNGATGVAMLPMLANTLAVACVAPLRELLLSEKRSYIDRQQWSWYNYIKSWRLKGKLLRRVAFVAFLDFLANVLVMIGLLFVGAGVYAVLFSSGVAFAALFSTVNGKRYSLRQWCGVALATLGMALNGLASVEDALDAGHGALGRFELGAGVILGGTALHSLSLVCAESVSAGEELTSFRLATYVGGVEASVLLAHNAVLLLARGADKLYLRHILKHQGDPTTVFIVYIALWFADLCHALAHYALLAGAGAVALTLSRGVQMLFVVGIAELAFCGDDSRACLTPVKFASVASVAFGILLYASKPRKPKRELLPAQ